jgi:hypothetical protein
MSPESDCYASKSPDTFPRLVLTPWLTAICLRCEISGRMGFHHDWRADSRRKPVYDFMIVIAGVC